MNRTQEISYVPARNNRIKHNFILVILDMGQFPIRHIVAKSPSANLVLP